MSQPVTPAEFVCALSTCDGPILEGMLCDRHQAMVGRTLPERLNKKMDITEGGRLTDEELELVRFQVNMDAAPLFILAWRWCATHTWPEEFLNALAFYNEARGRELGAA